jgi:hypothetical protein
MQRMLRWADNQAPLHSVGVSLMAKKTQAPTPTVGRRMPTWMMVLGVGVLSTGAAVVAAAVVVAIMFALVDFPSDKKQESIAQQKKTDADPPEKKEKEKEKPIEVPKNVEPPINVSTKPTLIVELPDLVGRACLSADGSRIAYQVPQKGSFGYREGPAFDVEKLVEIADARTGLHALASSPDGRRMAFAAGSLTGPRVYVWDWAAMKVEKTLFVSSLSSSSVFSPDGKYLATVVPRFFGKPLECWIQVHEINAARMAKQWHLNFEPNFVGFTADSGTILLAEKDARTAQSWTFSGSRGGTIEFPHVTGKHFFSRDFSIIAYVEKSHQLTLLNANGMRPLGKIETAKDASAINAAAFSVDNRLVLLGVHDAPKETGHARLVDVQDGKIVAATDALGGVPDRVELASNGIGLLQGPNMRPRLYQFAKPAVEFVIAPVPPQPKDGFVSLFNGKDLTGWRSPPNQPGNWRVKDGVLIGSGAAFDSLFTTRTDYKNFHLRLEGRINEGGRGAVFCRGPFGPATPPANPIRPIGFQAEINNTLNTMNRTGSLSVRHFVSVTTQGFQSFLQPNEWFTLEVIAVDDRVSLKLNGQPAVSLPDKDRQLASGAIGLYLENAGSVMEFRRIEIKEDNAVAAPPIAPAEGFVSLFNGKDLAGWKPHALQPGDWRAENGILAGKSKGGGFLFTTRGDFQDFHVRLEARFNPAWGSGVLFRYDLDYLGYEALIQDKFTGVLTVRTRSGPGNLRALMNKGNAAQQPLGEWIPMEIIAEGNRLRLKINGVTTADYVDDKNNFRSGHIGLRDFNGCIEFRNILIKELPPVAVAPIPPAPAAGAAPFPPDAAFTSLFNGKDLTGWKNSKPGPGNWRVIDGVLTGAGPNMGDLYTPRDDYADFHLRVEARINDAGLTNIAFRYPYDPEQSDRIRSGGYTTRINGRPNDFVKTGTFMVFEEVGVRNLLAKEQLMIAGQWFNLEIFAQGNQVTTRINGRDAVSFMNPKTHLNTGRIVLGFSDTNQPVLVEYRKIEIKTIKAVAMPAPPPPPRPLEAFVPLFNGKDLTGWTVNGNDTWKVTPGGELEGKGIGVSIASKRTDYRNFIARIEFSASDDAEAYFVFRQNHEQGKPVGLTSRIAGDGNIVRAGGAGINGEKFESMPLQLKLSRSSRSFSKCT